MLLNSTIKPSTFIEELCIPGFFPPILGSRKMLTHSLPSKILLHVRKGQPSVVTYREMRHKCTYSYTYIHIHTYTFLGAREFLLLMYMAEFRLDHEELVGASHQEEKMGTDFQMEESTNNDMLLVQVCLGTITVSSV